MYKSLSKYFYPDSIQTTVTHSNLSLLQESSAVTNLTDNTAWILFCSTIHTPWLNGFCGIIPGCSCDCRVRCNIADCRVVGITPMWVSGVVPFDPCKVVVGANTASPGALVCWCRSDAWVTELTGAPTECCGRLTWGWWLAKSAGLLEIINRHHQNYKGTPSRYHDSKIRWLAWRHHLTSITNAFLQWTLGIKTTQWWNAQAAIQKIQMNCGFKFQLNWGRYSDGWIFRYVLHPHVLQSPNL